MLYCRYRFTTKTPPDIVSGYSGYKRRRYNDLHFPLQYRGNVKRHNLLLLRSSDFEPFWCDVTWFDGGVAGLDI